MVEMLGVMMTGPTEGTDRDRTLKKMLAAGCVQFKTQGSLQFQFQFPFRSKTGC